MSPILVRISLLCAAMAAAEITLGPRVIEDDVGDDGRPSSLVMLVLQSSARPSWVYEALLFSWWKLLE